MTSPATPETRKHDIVLVAKANDAGHVVGLEPHQTYFVVRKPTKEYTQERSREFFSEVKTFFETQRQHAETQAHQLTGKYVPQAKERLHEVRSTAERTFDQLAKEFETRFERLEADLNEKADRLFRSRHAAPATEGAGETPGEMPTGEAAPTADKPKPKKTPRKSEG